MRILFVAINAKYIHRNLALDQLIALCDERGISCALHEGNISQSTRDILLSSNFETFDLVAFSVYLWNERMVRELAEDMKRVKPSLRLFAGGPEAYSRVHDFLPLFEGIIMGDGEAPFASILDSPDNPSDWFHVSTEHNIAPLYFEQELDRWPCAPVTSSDQILYYESSRGCPYRCSYCLSAQTPLVTRSIKRVKEDLSRFVEAKVPLVKLVDRSFNADLDRALKIIEYIKSIDQGHTTFHLELTPVGLCDHLLHSLKETRKDLFRYEIGIQSVDDDVNKRVNRPFRRASYWPALEKFMREAPGEKHLDLLVGIPGSSMENIEESLNALGSLRPEELQLGFLKVLPGTPLGKQAKDLQIIYGSQPPYEVLATADLSFLQIKGLKRMERQMDLFHSDAIPYGLEVLLQTHRFFDLFQIIAKELPDLRRATFSRRLKTLESCFPSRLLREALEIDYLRKMRSPRSLFYPERFRGYEKGYALFDSYFNGVGLIEDPHTVVIDQKNARVYFPNEGGS